MTERYTSHMSTTSTLDSFLDLIARCLTPDVAQKIAQIQLEPGIQERLDELAAKADNGELSEAERLEYEDLIDGLDLLGILKAKARSLLEPRSA
jgi:hypothetical protein